MAAKPLTLRQVKNAIRRLDDAITPDDEAYNVAMVMLSALAVGANIRRIARFTGLTYRYVTEIGRRLRANGVWCRSMTCCDWFEEENGTIAFWLDANIGLGYITQS